MYCAVGNPVTGVLAVIKKFIDTTLHLVESFFRYIVLSDCQFLSHLTLSLVDFACDSRTKLRYDVYVGGL
jgi:hypothetical protein